MEILQSTFTLLTALAVGGVVMLVLLVAGHRRLHVALIMLVVAFNACEINFFYYSYRPLLLQLRWLILPAVGLWVLILLKARGYRLAMDRLTFYFFALVVMAGAAAPLVTSQPSIPLYKTATLVMLLITCIIAFRTYIWRIEEGAMSIARDYAWLAVVLVAASLALFFFMPGVALRAGWLRGPFLNSNYLGAVLIALSPFLYLKYMNPGGRRRNFVFWVAYGFAVVTLVLSHSRSSAGAFLISLLVVVAVANWRFVPLLLMAAVAGLGFFWWTSGATASSLTLEGQRGVVEDFIYKDRASLMDTKRQAAQKIVLENIRSNFWFGVGYGISPEFEEKDQEERLETGYLVKREKANSYLAIQEELGFFGSVLVLLIILPVMLRGVGAMARGATRLGSRDPDVVLLVAFYSSTLGLLANAVFEAWMLSVGNPIAILFWTNLVAVDYATSRVRMKLAQPARDMEAVSESNRADEPASEIESAAATGAPSRPVAAYPAAPATPTAEPPSRFTY